MCPASLLHFPHLAKEGLDGQQASALVKFDRCVTGEEQQMVHTCVVQASYSTRLGSSIFQAQNLTRPWGVKLSDEVHTIDSHSYCQATVQRVQWPILFSKLLGKPVLNYAVL